MEKKDLLKDVVEHIDIKKYDSTELINAMRKMSFTSRDTARAADILCQMIAEKDCTNILTIAGSTSAAGCMQVYVEMVKNKMVDAVVSTGADVVLVAKGFEEVHVDDAGTCAHHGVNHLVLNHLHIHLHAACG